ncbi:hypothetical protein [Xylanimonas sp. McL0601]|uniref:hypothetical protein n=1 Tax=Xylanimonas sp. McL0601 TaxID=3414739 RepID=UPI003CF5B535
MLARVALRSADKRTDILRLHEQGVSVRKIATQLRLGRTAVHNVVRTGAIAA